MVQGCGEGACSPQELLSCGGFLLSPLLLVSRPGREREDGVTGLASMGRPRSGGLHFWPHPFGQNLVAWPHLSSRKAEKWTVAISPEESKTGFVNS